MNGSIRVKALMRKKYKVEEALHEERDIMKSIISITKA
jgi:hypothetical protein